MTFLSGLCAFPITPTDRSGQIDTAGLRKLVARLVAADVDSIGLLGSTGGYMYLTREQRRRAIEAALAETRDRIPVVAGVGALRTDDAIALALDAKAIGAAAGLLAPVSYTPLTEAEVFEHFSTVARESGLPIIIYDNPGTTHFRFSPGLVGRLARTPGIVGIKNPSEDRAKTAIHYSEQRALVPSGFSIGYSADWNCAEAMIAEADTWYSVLGGLFPKVCVSIVRAAQRGDADEARRLDKALSPLWDLFKQYSSLRVIYALIELLEIGKVEPPRPILSLIDKARQQVADILARLPTEVTQ